MKKSLIALAVLSAFAGAAQAQTSVTIYGSFDGGLRYQDNVNAAGDSRVTLGSIGNYNNNRLGFKGVEDLGGGLNAHFNLEAGWNTGTGAMDNAGSQLFQRAAFVGLGGSWGSVDFGRQYSNSFMVIGLYDPFNYKYTGIASAVPASDGYHRVNNDAKYTGTFGAVTVRAEHAFGEVAGDFDDGVSNPAATTLSTVSMNSVAVSYSEGPLAGGFAYTQRTADGIDANHYTLGASYKFGAARVAAGYAHRNAETPGEDSKRKWYWVGGSYAISPAVELTAAYYKTKDSGLTAGKKDLYMIGATYALSKRTNLYSAIDYAKLDGSLNTIAPEDKQLGFSIGINHLF